MNVHQKIADKYYKPKPRVNACPSKPYLKPHHSTDDIAAYLDSMIKYDKEMDKYKKGCEEYCNEKKRLDQEFREDLINHYFKYEIRKKFPSVANEIFKKAYEEGHDSSLERIAYEFEVLYDIFEPALTGEPVTDPVVYDASPGHPLRINTDREKITIMNLKINDYDPPLELNFPKGMKTLEISVEPYQEK